MAAKRVIAAVIGQSNEAGTGVIADRTPSYGCPLRDPVKPNGGKLRSMWPYLSELAGRRGVWLNIYNSAVGATSIVHSWCGYIRNWVSSIQIVPGSLVLSGGHTWKATAVSAFLNVSTVAPVAGGPDASGITWSDLGVSAGTDAVGLLGSSHPRFDPNGYIAAALAGLSSATGYDEKWCFISIGQTDKSMSVPSSEYSSAIQTVTSYMLANGVKVAIGFTCYAPGAEAWYQSDLLPGVASAQAAFSGNQNVISGANLRNSLGVLATTPASGAGLQADALHMNDAAYILASESWRDSLVSAAWI